MLDVTAKMVIGWTYHTHGSSPGSTPSPGVLIRCTLEMANDGSSIWLLVPNMGDLN